jgi:translation initiation factor IF-2
LSTFLIVGFNTSLATGAREAADAVGVDVREYNIIYKQAKVDERHI